MSKKIYYWSKTTWIIVCMFFVLAGITRFYRLDWSFWGDEPSTFMQVDLLFEQPFFATQSGENTLGLGGRANPVGYSLQKLVYKFFGKGERETRLGVATAGTLVIALVVLLTSRLYGQFTGLVLGGILLLAPWHLFHSQNQRNYSYAFLFGSIALLAFALAWKENNKKWAMFSGVMSALTVATHSLSILIPVALAVFVISEFLRRKDPLPWRAIRNYLYTGGPLLLILCLWAWIVLWKWAATTQVWGYTSIHTLMGLAVNLNWGIVLTACAGWVWAMWSSDDSTDRLWASVATAAVFFAVVAPLFLAFRHDYVFSSTLAFFMLAARALTQIYESVKKQSRLLAITFAMVFVLFPLPSFVSHYQDGNRHDYRTAAKFISDHSQPGDIFVSSDWTGVLRYYFPFPVTHIPKLHWGAESISHLEQLSSSGKRIWLVSALARQEYPSDVDQWLWKNAVRMLRIKKRRFDYHENITDVYLLNGENQIQ